jgi:hypothetical protein
MYMRSVNSFYPERYRVVRRLSARGTPYTLLERIVPRINDQNLDVVFYLYSSRDEAERGESVGASGFFVSVESKARPNAGYLYAVTNRHVIEKGRLVIRLNTKDGEIDFIETTLESWEPHREGEDLAVCAVGLRDEYKYCSVAEGKVIHEGFLLTDPPAIGPGEDVMVIGRFINHEGKDQNFPTARFGAIAMMPSEPIYNRQFDNSKKAFLIEMRSMGGYSGAPVFVLHRDSKKIDAIGSWVDVDEPEPFLLGVLVAHSITYTPVMREIASGELEKTDLWVESNTGLAIVCPAWHIYEILELDRFKMAREKNEEEIRKRQRNSSAMPDDSEPPPNRTQRTKKGYEIPIPKRDEVFDVFKKATRKRDNK